MPSVQLYCYDLSGGMAAQMSLAFAGRHFEAIWHTSVVYDGEIEVFFGQGIMECPPGMGYLGQPLKKLDFGETEIDHETFYAYIEDLRSVWTPEKYHLLQRNCNNFSDEVVDFLTGRHVPRGILDLPSEFLATPLGASMMPMIDSMFRDPASAPAATTSTAPP